jgi:hypothetical protein
VEIITLILDYVVVPLIAWLIYIDRKIIKLESEKTTNEDLEKIYAKLDSINKKIDSSLVTQKLCDVRHDKNGTQ